MPKRSMHRKDLRVAVRIPLEVKTRDAGKTLRCWARDLSSGGMLFSCPNALLLGSLVDLSFQIDGDTRRIRLTGMVCRVRPALGFSEEPRYLIATNFLQVSDAMAKHLRNIVTEHVMDLVNCVRDFPAFSSLTEFDLLTLAGICHTVDLDAGNVLVRQGDEASSLFVVLAGLVKLTCRGDGDTNDAVEVAGSGQIFGEVSALTGLPHDLDITALEETQLIAITRDGFQFLRENHPETALRLMEVFMRFTGMRLRRLTRRLFSPLTIR